MDSARIVKEEGAVETFGYAFRVTAHAAYRYYNVGNKSFICRNW